MSRCTGKVVCPPWINVPEPFGHFLTHRVPKWEESQCWGRVSQDQTTDRNSGAAHCNFHFNFLVCLVWDLCPCHRVVKMNMCAMTHQEQYSREYFLFRWVRWPKSCLFLDMFLYILYFWTKHVQYFQKRFLNYHNLNQIINHYQIIIWTNAGH